MDHVYWEEQKSTLLKIAIQFRDNHHYE